MWGMCVCVECECVWGVCVCVCGFTFSFYCLFCLLFSFFSLNVIYKLMCCFIVLYALATPCLCLWNKEKDTERQSEREKQNFLGEKEKSEDKWQPDDLTWPAKAWKTGIQCVCVCVRACVCVCVWCVRACLCVCVCVVWTHLISDSGFSKSSEFISVTFLCAMFWLNKSN